ncbi:MAG: protease complex subunit PrcB family protein [Rhodospirillales bacterium]|nr:protease complex subunit PrcB family protein [Rhodospirillales bacterium]
MAGLFRALFLIGLIVPLAAAAAEREWQGSAGAGARFQVDVARTATEWQALWRKIGQEPPPPPNFAEGEIAAAIVLGTRSTGGYRIELTLGARIDGVQLVEWEERPPAGPATQALTAPYAVRGFDVGAELAIAFQRRGGDRTLIVPEGEFRRITARTNATTKALDEQERRIQHLQDNLRTLEDKLRRIESAVGVPPIRPH